MGKISNNLSFVNVYNILKILGSKTGTTAAEVVNCFATVMKVDPRLLCGKIEKQLRLGVNDDIFQYANGLYRVKPVDKDEPKSARGSRRISNHDERHIREVDHLVEFCRRMLNRNKLPRSRKSSLRRRAAIMKGLSTHYKIMKGLTNHFKNSARKKKAASRCVASKPRQLRRKTTTSGQQPCQCRIIAKPRDSKPKPSPLSKKTLIYKANILKPTKNIDFQPTKKSKYDYDLQEIFNPNLKIDFSVKSPKQQVSQQPRRPENTFSFNGGNGLNNSTFGHLFSPEMNSTSHRKNERPTPASGKQTQGKSRQPKGMDVLKGLGLDTLVKVVDNPLKKRRGVKWEDLHI